jgi:hypothetical protein
MKKPGPAKRKPKKHRRPQPTNEIPPRFQIRDPNQLHYRTE